MVDPMEVPDWLLKELHLSVGFFYDKTTIRGRPTAQAKAAGNLGNGPSDTLTVDLVKRADWKTIKKRLTDEGF